MNGMNKVLLVLLVMLSLSMIYAATAKGKTAAKKDVSKKEKTMDEKKKEVPAKTKNVVWWTLAKKYHSAAVFKMMPEMKKKMDAIVRDKGLSRKKRRLKLHALYRKNPTAYNAVVQTYVLLLLHRHHRRAGKKSQR
ncbi:hypothetical protein GCK32_017409 [Trichostrongylus colubriformis]|uniref:Uncharacterized protein n=1 Tax=Trichostrongylus colubriformis TaxID=6319 RepID=A0AAN8FT12_TRICO